MLAQISHHKNLLLKTSRTIWLTFAPLDPMPWKVMLIFCVKSVKDAKSVELVAFNQLVELLEFGTMIIVDPCALMNA